MRLKKLLLLCFAVISSLGFSQFKFNEYSCANVGAVIDPIGVGYEKSPDWIELMNITNTKQTLSGWYISQNIHASNGFQIPLDSNQLIKVDSFGVQVILLCTHNKTTVGTIATQTVNIHANFQLNQTQNPVLYLFHVGGGNPVDSIHIKRNKPDHSWGKPNSDSAAFFPDTVNTGFGLNAWRLYPKPSPGKKNPNNRHYYNTNPPLNYYLDYAPTPKFMTKPGYFNSSATLTITDTTSQSPTLYKDSLEIFATTDCTNPLTYSVGTVFPLANNVTDVGHQTGIISIPYWGSAAPSPPPNLVGVVVRAIIHDQTTYRPNYLDGFEAYGAYILDSTYHIGVTCVCLDTTALFTAPTPPQINDTSGTPGKPSAIFCYVDKTTKKQVFQNQGQGLVNRIDFLNNFNPKRQWQFQFRAEDEYGYNYTNKYGFFTDQSLGITARADFPELIFRSSAEDNFLKGGGGGLTGHGATHLRDFFNHTLTLRHKLDFESSHYVPTYLFINGINRGIYYIKEPIDTTYTKYYYNYAQADIIANDLAPTTTIPQIKALAGKLSDWSNFYAQVMNTGYNVQVPANYKYISDTLDIKSFWDYNFYNMYSVNADFVRRQALWWKGLPDTSIHSTLPKWRFGLSNTDITWGSNYNYTGINNTPNNAPCDYFSAFGPAANNQYPLMPLFYKLLNNDTFRSGFFARYQDLINTSYTCDTLTAHLAYVQSLLLPDMRSQVWWNVTSGAGCAGCDSVKFWKAMVDSMKVFIMQRCTLALQSLSSGNCNQYPWKGPYNLCIDVSPANSGFVNFNSLSLHNFVWNGKYLDSINYHAYAVPDSNYVFDHWQTPFPVKPNTNTDSITFYVTQDACLTAVFKLKPAYETTGTPMLPQAFSPNGDGNNDILNIYGIENATSYAFDIYNRWGEQLFHSTDKTKGWDGNYNGSPAAVGVYAYRYNITIHGKTYIKNGSVTLLK
ncbi:MAG TPA: gliding motility-associated C-terminal domain-containing protein [Bacteroidia bacterium]